MDEEIKAKIFYYCREKLYNTMQNVAEEAAAKFPTNNPSKLYKALAQVLGNRAQEGTRELEFLQDENDVELAVILCLMYSHRNKSNDKSNLETRLKEVRRNASSLELYYAAVVLFAFGKVEKAREYIDKSVKGDSQFTDALVMKNWIELYGTKNGKTSSINFQKVDARNLDAMLAEAEWHEMEKKYDSAIGVLNKAVVKFPTVSLPLLKKMKVRFAQQDWEQVAETMTRITSSDGGDLEATKFKILVKICRDGKCDEAVELLKAYYQEMEAREPKNLIVYLENAQLFSRICGRNVGIICEAIRFAEKATQLDPDNALPIIELGYLNLLQGRIKEALRYYRSATKVDETSFEALIGMTLCELTENGLSGQVHSQVEFLCELKDSEPSPLLSYLQAKLAHGNAAKAVGYLNEACEAHFKKIESIPYGDTYLRLLDPDFLFDVAKEYLKYSSQQSELLNMNKKIGNSDAVLQKSLHILEVVTKACPGLEYGLFQLAQIQFLNGDVAASMNTLNRIVEINPSSAESHLLMAQIFVRQGLYQRASQSLEVGLSYNFKVRENPLFHLITGLVEKNSKNMDAAIKSFTTALSLVDIKPKDTSYTKTSQLTLADKASLYVEIINAHIEAHQSHEALKIFHDAIDEFKGTPEESRMMVLNADIVLANRDIQTAIKLYSQITPEEPYYLQAHTKLAKVYLNHRKDRSAFMQCYNEVVEHCPGSDSLVLKGDALMSIQEPELAIESYEQALKCSPQDATLASKMGNALVLTHQYLKAINYYKDAIKSTDSSELKVQLADLYLKLREYDKAEYIMKDEISANKKNEDFLSLQIRTKNYLFLAEIQESAGNISGALSTLKDARDNQNRVRRRLNLEQQANSPEETQTTMKICMRMGELSASLRDNEQAVQHYKDALNLIPKDTGALAALAKLYMQMNFLELCQQTCATLLQVDPENEAGSLMMADLAFRKVDFDMASFHYMQLLNKQPTNWTALARLIEVMRRIGTLQEAKQYLTKAEDICYKGEKESGLSYCNGLFDWYTGNPNSALRNFNKVRQDPEWGQRAIYNMIEICLNYEEMAIRDDNTFTDLDADYNDSKTIALSTASKLLKELKPRPGGLDDESLKQRLLGNFLLLATKEKSNIEKALEDFTATASQETFRDHVGPILGVATAHILLRQQQRARNQLKRVAKNIWTFEDAEYLERCWLLLADLYIQSSKYDMALDLLHRIIEHNRTCGKAYEYSGMIAEKEQNYKEAAGYYEHAYQLSGKTNLSIGIKLAFCYNKCKKYAAAIDVGSQMLKLYPDHPDNQKFRKEVLDKAINCLRT